MMEVLTVHTGGGAGEANTERRAAEGTVRATPPRVRGEFHTPTEGHGLERTDTRSANCGTPDGYQHEQDDVALLRRIASDDDQALRVFYQRYSGLVYSLAYSILSDTTRAEEVLQETFIRVWRAAITFDPARGRPEAWVVTIARNLAFSALRRSRALPQTEPPEEMLIADDPDSDPEEVAWQSARRSLVQQAMLQLPEKQRQVVVLAYFDGLTHVEIAERTGEPLGTVKSRLRLALRHLHDSLHVALGEVFEPPVESAPRGLG